MQLLLWFALAINAVILLAAIVKWREVVVASKWPATTGRIVASEAEARRVARFSSGEDRVKTDEVRNFAAITYAFNVGKARFHGNRIGIGEDPGNVGIAETLKRYPKGAEVTIYYDPANPGNCVLERDPPSKSFFRSLFGGGIAAAIVIVAMLAGANGLLSAGLFKLPDLHWTPATVFAVCLAACGLVLVRAAVRLRKMQRRWLKTSGTIISSEAVRLDAHFDWLNPRRYFRGRTVYEYVVDGVRYQSDRISFGDLHSTSNRHVAEDDADRFEPGRHVDVYYDPDVPSSAVLQPSSAWLSWWWFGSAAFVLLLAMWLLA